MDFRDPKNQKIMMGVAAFLIVAYFWYSKLYTGYDERLTKMNQEYSTMITNLKNVEMKSKSLDALTLEYEDLLARYREIEMLLPEVRQIPSFLVQLHTASSLTGTKIVKIEPLPIKPENFYNVAGFEIEMTGTYHNFGKFIGYVANFPFIANLSEVELTTTSIANTAGSASESEDSGINQKTTMNVKFVLSTYFVRAEERLQELVL
nr:type 4a pilus biogenesis protein PilO [candidate division Zixibacteria bacterium]